MAIVTRGNDRKTVISEEELPAQVEPAQPPPPKDPVDGPSTAAVPSPRGSLPKPGPSAPGFFTIYKKGQGYWTRLGTAIGAAFLGVLVSYEISRQLPTFLSGAQDHDKHIALIVALVFLIAYSLWAFWLMNKSSSVDFLVATDSEMKKVNWTTRAELIGSTKIVVLFMFLIALFLFTCDLLFGGFFHLIGVLKTWF
jgi:preprotein translocase subunit SecE